MAQKPKADDGESNPDTKRQQQAGADMSRIWRKIRQLWRAETWPLSSVLLIGGLLLAFGLIANQVMDGKPLAFDERVIRALRSATDPSNPIGPPWLQEAARDITALGSYAVLGTVVFAVIVYLLLVRMGAVAGFVMVAVIGGLGMNNLLKIGFARPRPELIAPAVRVFTPSFPSGHAALSAITYLTLGSLLARAHSSHRVRIYFLSVGVLLSLLVGASRIYLGVHFPTDVLAGWCIGSAWALACWVIMTRIQLDDQASSPGQP